MFISIFITLFIIPVIPNAPARKKPNPQTKILTHATKIPTTKAKMPALMPIITGLAITNIIISIIQNAGLRFLCGTIS